MIWLKWEESFWLFPGNICGDYWVFFHFTSVTSLAWHPLRPVPVTPGTGAVQGLKVPTITSAPGKKKSPHQIMIDVWEGPTSNSALEAKRGCTADFSSINNQICTREKSFRWQVNSQNSTGDVLVHTSSYFQPCLPAAACSVSHPCSPPPPWCFGRPAVCWEFSTLDSTTCRQPSAERAFSEASHFQAWHLRWLKVFCPQHNQRS